MGDLNRGVTFVDGETQVDAAGLHSLVEDATLKAESVSGKSAASALSVEDKILLYDFSEDALRSLSYSLLRDSISAATSVTGAKKTVTQTHAFSVGDVVRIKNDGTVYEKASAKFNSYNFATTDVNTGNDRVTLPANTVIDGEQVILSSTGTLPAPLVSGVRYYAKKIDSVTTEFYTDSGLTIIVDLTDVGSGTHTIYNELERAFAVGVVTSVPDSDGFTVTLTGEATGLSGLTAGKIYYLSTTAGDMTDTPPTELGRPCQPVLIATSTTAGIVVPCISPSLAVASVRSEHIAEEAVGREELSGEIRALLDRNIGSDRQTVLAGRKDANGIANFLEAGTGLQVVLKASTTDPFIGSFANGFNEDDGYNFVERITSDKNFNSLAASSELFLYIDRDSNGTLTYLNGDRCPEYGFAKSLYRTRHAFPRLYAGSTENGVTITSTGEVAGFEAYKAFNGIVTDYWRCNTNGACFIRHQYTYGKVINRYYIRGNANAVTKGPSAWTFDGSNDGTTWTTIDARSSITWSASETKSYDTSNTSNYKYYRLNISSVAGGAVACELAEVYLCEAINHYYVIPEGAMYYHNGTTWATVNRLFVGEVRTGAATVSAGSTTSGLFTYAIRGIYVSPTTSIIGNSAYPLASAIGTQNVFIDLFTRQDISYTYNRVPPFTTGATLPRVEIGYLADDSPTAANTLGGDPRLERLYTSIVATSTDIIAYTGSITSTQPSGVPQSGDAYIITRRPF